MHRHVANIKIEDKKILEEASGLSPEVRQPPLLRGKGIFIQVKALVKDQEVQVDFPVVPEIEKEYPPKKSCCWW